MQRLGEILIKDTGRRKMAEPDMAVQANPANLVVWKPNLILRIFGGLVKKTVDSVVAMPDLEKPHFKGNFKSNPLVLFVDSWAYMYRLFEYSTEPLGKGYVAWVRLALSIVLYLLAPVGALMGCVYLILYMVVGVVGAATETVCKVLLLFLSVLALILLSYLVYAVICMLVGIPIKVPVPKFKVER